MYAQMNSEHEHAAPTWDQPSQQTEGKNVKQAPPFQLTSEPVAPQLDLNSPDFVQQLIDTADYRFLSNRKHHLGWHNSLDKQKAPAKKGKQKDTVGPEDAITPAPLSPAAIARFCGDIDQQLANVTFPTNSGTDFNEHKNGHRYMARSHDKNAQAAAHTEYGKTAALSTIGIDSPTDTQQRTWEHFHIVMGEEGDTSALNIWDAQIVTMGSGLSGKSGQAGKMLARLPQAYQDKLYALGIFIGDKGSIKYLDPKTQKVHTDDNAWRELKKNRTLLAHLTNMAQSQEEIATDANPDEKVSMRQAMMRAQFDQFAKNNAQLMNSKFKSGPYNTRALAVKLHHWFPGMYNWKRVLSGEGTISAMPTDFDSALKWGRDIMASGKFAGHLKQYDRLKRFKKVTSSKAAKAYAEKQFDR